MRRRLHIAPKADIRVARQTGGKVEALCGAHVKPTRHARRPVCLLCVDLQLALTNPTIWTYPAMPTPTTFSTNTQILHPRMYA